ncbi:MAG: prepilin-type N-terminal cleavage/methylation domain-containing protein [Candidatus Omnitrophica bacterium]|nr:prepilin-type N-terminal cleavage/methylation domain-containing protein [Candidatus Omnitrophota bacterium]
MKNRAFTLVEIIVTVVIVGILATIGLPTYQNVLESSKERVCDTNLLTLQKAVEMYTMEHDTVPGALSQLNDKYIRKAYVEVMSGKDAWKIKLAYFLVNGPQRSLAYAVAGPELYGLPSLRCPDNPDKNTYLTRISYGINSGVAGLTALGYKNLDDNTVIVADSRGEVFSYTGSGGSTSSNPDSGASDFPCSEIIHSRGHKKYQVFSTPKYYLRGITKDERKGSFIECGAFAADNP